MTTTVIVGKARIGVISATRHGNKDEAHFKGIVPREHCFKDGKSQQSSFANLEESLDPLDSSSYHYSTAP
jgi:hypothetical protein